MSKLRAAVIGVGHLGRFHAQKYAALDDIELVAVVDNNAEQAQKVADELGAEALTDYHQLIGRIDLASIVVPTSLHYKVAGELLDAGVHLLVEKPITTTVKQGAELVEKAKQKNLVLQVGHLERFNPVISELKARADAPIFIESHRLASFKPRGTDVSVILDLMIHDIDLIQNIVGQPVQRIDASGGKVVSDHIDIANARIQFANGCVANVTASRISLKAERRMRLFQQNTYLAADMGNRVLHVYHKHDAASDTYAGIPGVGYERLEFAEADALMIEIQSFADAVRNGTTPVVSGEDGVNALRTAIEVTRQLEANPLPGQAGLQLDA